MIKLKQLLLKFGHGKKKGRMVNGRRFSERRDDEVEEVRNTHNCRKTNMNRVHHWFGDTSEEDRLDSLSQEEANWDKVDREGKNQDRRRRTRERRERKSVKIAGKARRMAGLGPITDCEIETQRRWAGNYETTKIWAVKAHLAANYQYNQEELDKLDIVETKRMNKDDIVYIAVRNERDIRDIYHRKAECRNDETVVKHYIPPHSFKRFDVINKICAKKRSEDRLLKTQLKFGERYLIILTKEKGSDKPYKEVDLAEFTANIKLPEFDMTMKWRMQEDRPPRRKVGNSPGPAGGKDRDDHPAEQNQLIRLHSDNGTSENTRKKQITSSKDSKVGTPATRNNDMDTTL